MINFFYESSSGFSNLAGAWCKSSATSSIYAGCFLYSKFYQCTILFHQSRSDLFEEINECQRCIYYMYLLSFEAKAFFGESILVHCHLKVQISSHVHSFQDMNEAKAANDAVFFPQPRSHKNKVNKLGKFQGTGLIFNISTGGAPDSTGDTPYPTRPPSSR